MSVDELKAFVGELRGDIAAQERWTIGWAIAALFLLTCLIGCVAQLSFCTHQRDTVQKQACERGYGAYIPDEHGSPIFQWNNQPSQPSEKDHRP